jgi:phosphoribosylformylglycinamidine cyclo-ligase
MPPLFRVLQQAGGVSTEEMRDVFNLGIGFIAVLPAGEMESAVRAATTAGVRSWRIGAVRAGPRGVRFAE